MENATIIGVDLAKNVFQVHGVAADGTVLFSKKLTRLQFHRSMAEQLAFLVAMWCALLGARDAAARP